MIPVTVFTPTYDRLSLLKRLYTSLQRQTVKEFEWVVVDDGSEDETDKWVQSIISSAPFDIKYKKVPHGGKHRAINIGLNMAAGEYFFIVDSDDYLPDDAIAVVSEWIREVRGIDYLAGVAGLRADPSGRVIGERPAKDSDTYVECSSIERYRMKLQGDKAEVYRTSLLKEYPFPEFDGEFFLTERVVWDRIAHDGYKIRWYNTPIYFCEYTETGLTNSGANSLQGHLANYRGYLEFVKQSVYYLEPVEALAVFRNYNVTARKKGIGIPQRAEDIGFSIRKYLIYMFIKVPFYYSIRILLGL